MTSAKTRRKYGESMDTSPSRFLEEIDADTINLQKLEDASPDAGVDFLKELEKLKVG